MEIVRWGPQSFLLKSISIKEDKGGSSTFPSDRPKMKSQRHSWAEEFVEAEILIKLPLHVYVLILASPSPRIFSFVFVLHVNQNKKKTKISNFIRMKLKLFCSPIFRIGFSFSFLHLCKSSHYFVKNIFFLFEIIITRSKLNSSSWLLFT